MRVSYMGHIAPCSRCEKQAITEELCSVLEPFLGTNGSDDTVTITVPSEAVTRARRVVARAHAANPA